MPKHMVKGSGKRLAKELSQKKKNRTMTQLSDLLLMPDVLILLADSAGAKAGLYFLAKLKAREF